MLIIRTEQRAALSISSWKHLEERMLPHVREYYPIDHALLGEPGTRRFLTSAIDRARGRGVERFGEACRYIGLMLSLGTRFDDDPQLPPSVTGADASADFDALYLAALGYLERISGEDGKRYVRALFKARALDVNTLLGERGDFQENLRVTLGRIHRRKLRDLSPRLPAFADLASSLAGEAGMNTPGPRLVYAVFMFLLGSHFATDALHPWAGEALGDADTPAAKAGALAAAGRRHLDRALALIAPKS